MGVYIRGMEMPKDGTFNIVYIYPEGHVSMPFWGKGVQIVQGINAVPIPPHGRLIDADKLCELCGIMADNSDDIFKSIWNQFKTTVEWCPTITPAEEG